MKKTVLAMGMAAATFLALPAAAQTNLVDVYYIPSADLELSDSGLRGTDDGDGFGFKGQFKVADQAFITGEYQTVEYDDSSIEIDQLRFGLGFMAPINTSVNFIGRVEYARAKIDIPGFGSDSENGYGLHAGFDASLSPEFSLNGSIGYLDIGDANGPEFLFGARYRVNPNVSLFADYRVTQLSDSGTDLDLEDLRFGVGFFF